MSRSTRNLAAIIVLLALLVAGIWWSQASQASPPGRLVVAGDVRPDVRTVSAPAISYPAPDYAVGIPRVVGSSGNGSAPRERTSAAARTGQPVVAGMLKRVLVREGDRVKAGQVVVEFDAKMLDLGVDQATTAERKARKDVSVMSENIDELTAASDKLTTARAKLATARRGLLKAKSALLKARGQLLAQQRKLRAVKAQRPQLEAALAGLKAQAATFPPGQVPAALQKQIAALTRLLASIDPGLKAIAKGLRTVNTNLGKVNRGFAALPGARAKITRAEEKLADAKQRLRDAKDVLGIVADGQSTAIQIAKTRRLQATVRSPIDGTVTFARHNGTVAMVGAPLVRIQADGQQRVDTYLTTEQLPAVGIGSEADITFDSAPGQVLHGRISEFGSEYAFPPTSFATQIVHMTRTLKVTVLLDEGADAPPGTPVDVSLHTNANR